MKLGLKTWSSNKDFMSPAETLYRKGVYDYIELYVNPASADTDALEWRKLKIPFQLHAPHSYSGLNLSLKSKEAENRQLIRKVDFFRKQLNPSYIIFHPGLEGKLEETLRQLKVFKTEFPEVFEKVIIENKPKLGLKGELCLGAMPQEIGQIMDSIGIGFCLDIGHAIYYAAWAKLPWQKIVEEFNALKPRAYHLSDGDIASFKDMHEHFGSGNFDFEKIMTMIPGDSFLAIETKRDSWKDLNDFEKDVDFIKRYLK